MPLVPIKVAAELAGRDRSTILRAIESGKLSASKSEVGHYLIDPAELERVYGALRTPDVQTDAPPLDAQAAHVAALERELALVREMLERETAHHRDTRSAYASDRRTWEEERTFMRGMLEKHTDQIKLLTDQREERERIAAAAQVRPSLLARLFRRA